MGGYRVPDMIGRRTSQVLPSLAKSRNSSALSPFERQPAIFILQVYDAL